MCAQLQSTTAQPYSCMISRSAGHTRYNQSITSLESQAHCNVIVPRFINYLIPIRSKTQARKSNAQSQYLYQPVSCQFSPRTFLGIALLHVPHSHGKRDQRFIRGFYEQFNQKLLHTRSAKNLQNSSRLTCLIVLVRSFISLLMVSLLLAENMSRSLLQ